MCFAVLCWLVVLVPTQIFTHSAGGFAHVYKKKQLTFERSLRFSGEEELGLVQCIEKIAERERMSFNRVVIEAIKDASRERIVVGRALS